jgi:SAM-dependent methyltransferase
LIPGGDKADFPASVISIGIYGSIILPRLLDMAMRNSRLSGYRQVTTSAARGRVLEIGIGSGLNLPLYGWAVDQVCGIDPSPELLDRARKRIADAHVMVSLVRASAEQLPFADAAFDAIVMTWTLCSIPNPVAALTEMRRVLKQGGQLHFVEHGLSPEPRLAHWQRRFTPCWKRIGGGCHLDRKMDDLIRAAGFDIDVIATGFITGPKPWTFMYQGSATKY